MDLDHPSCPPGERACSWCGAPLDVAPLLVVWQGVAVAHDVCPRHVGDQLRHVAATAAPEQSAAARRTQAVRRLHRHEDLEQIRAWALARGLPAARTGGLSAAVMAAWRTHADAARAAEQAG